MSPPILSAADAGKPFEEGFLDTDGHRLYWAAFGPPEAPPILFVHGGHGHVFDMARFNLPKDHRVIILHQRGIGRSQPLGSLRHNTLDDNIDDIEKLRTHLGIEKWDIFSWSFGAIYMCAYASAHPEHCNQLVSYGPYLATEQDWDVVKDKRFFAHHGAANALEYTKNAFENLAAATPETWLRSLYNTSKAAGNTQSFEEFTNACTPETWDRKFKECLVGALHEKQALHDLPPLWLAERTATSGFAALDISLIFGHTDPWAAPNTSTSRVCPQAQILQIPANTHDVHDPSIQKHLAVIFQNLKSSQKPKQKAQPKFKFGP